MGERDQESSAGRQGGEQGRQPARNRVSRGVALDTRASTIQHQLYVLLSCSSTRTLFVTSDQV